MAAGCAGVPSQSHVWHDDDKRGVQYERILLVALTQEGDKRKSFEDSLRARLQTPAIEIWTSSSLMGINVPVTADSINPLLQSTGAEAVIVTRVKSIGVDPVQVDSYTDVVAKRRKGSVLTYDYVEKELPAFIRNEFTTVLTTDVYDARSSASIYTLVSSASGQESLSDVIEVLSRAIAKRLRSDGVVR
ncbi:MAG: hypothetical protein V2J12_13185 [Gammaproteobacteria bacterium]|jgi:hypothetical protein|nr:hypothetical protein [Gammaproteobacteria bacterium]